MAENTDSTRTLDDVKIGEEYDKSREDRLDVESKKLGDDRKVENGVVVSGVEPTGMITLYPGQDDVTSGGVAIREARGLSTEDIVEQDDVSWTAQSAKPYVESNAANVPGQTFTLDELPDPAVMAASGLPAHTLPANLLVDGAITDSLNSSQERGGDLGTSPKRDEEGAPVAAKQVTNKKQREAAGA